MIACDRSCRHLGVDGVCGVITLCVDGTGDPEVPRRREIAEGVNVMPEWLTAAARDAVSGKASITLRLLERVEGAGHPISQKTRLEIVAVRQG